MFGDAAGRGRAKHVKWEKVDQLRLGCGRARYLTDYTSHKTFFAFCFLSTLEHFIHQMFQTHLMVHHRPRHFRPSVGDFIGAKSAYLEDAAFSRLTAVCRHPSTRTPHQPVGVDTYRLVRVPEGPSKTPSRSAVRLLLCSNLVDCWAMEKAEEGRKK